MDQDRKEVHIFPHPLGHCMSADCWCEPKEIWLARLEDGTKVLIIQHVDIVTAHHKVVLAGRDQVQDWITRFLNQVTPLPPNRQLGTGL